MAKQEMDYEDGGYTQVPTKKPGANVFIDDQIGSTITTHPKRAAMNQALIDRGPEAMPSRKRKQNPVPAPKVDDLADVRADLLANQRADEAARAAAERKRQEAEAFSKRLKSATARPAASKTGYDSYKSLMGE